jgi:hypothetical protein
MNRRSTARVREARPSPTGFYTSIVQQPVYVGVRLPRVFTKDTKQKRLPIEKPFVTFVTFVVSASSISAELY